MTITKRRGDIMSLFMIKSLLAAVFFAASIVAVVSMLTMMGKKDTKMSPKTLRIIHKTAGFIFLILLLVLSIICIKYWIQAGDQISTRAVLHAVLSFGLIVVFLIKICIVQFYKQLLRMMPALGLIVFSLAFVITGISAGYYVLRSWSAPPLIPAVQKADTPAFDADPENGRILFADKCAMCHNADSEEGKAGPGLKGLMNKAVLPVSKREATVENVRAQILKPFLGMPAFPELPGQEMADLLAYLAIL
jgi:mono/diheme cytochrome c family protein